MLSKEDARRAVAQKACEMLHKKGALNDNLLPVQSSSESESDGEDETDGTSLHKTGTRKRQREHIVKVPHEIITLSMDNLHYRLTFDLGNE